MDNRRTIVVSNQCEMQLEAILASLAPRQIRLGCLPISPGDEDLLLPGEAAGFRTSALKARRQSGAARALARELLREFGIGDLALPRTESGATQWPAGIVGSLAHDDEVAVAGIARRHEIVALGVDVEPAIPLPRGISRIVATRRERGRYSSEMIESRLLFSLKEAVYKAQYPLDAAVLDFADVEIDLDARRGVTPNGRSFTLRFVTAPRVVTIAYLSAKGSV
jgi:4'-phosphopantetheinyl transferase EntD